MNTINVGMLKIPRMLKAILSNSLAQEADLKLIDLDQADRNQDVELQDLQALLVGSNENDEESRVWSLLESNPSLSVFAINRDGKRARCFVFSQQLMEELSASDLLETFRSLGRENSPTHPLSGESHG